MCIYVYIYIYISGAYSSVVRVSASGGGGPGFNPHHIKLSGLEVDHSKSLEDHLSTSGANTKNL